MKNKKNNEAYDKQNVVEHMPIHNLIIILINNQKLLSYLLLNRSPLLLFFELPYDYDYYIIVL